MWRNQNRESCQEVMAIHGGLNQDGGVGGGEKWLDSEYFEGWVTGHAVKLDVGYQKMRAKMAEVFFP